VRRREFTLAASAWLAGAGGIAIAQQPPGGERRVHIGAARFAFSVSEIEAKRGETIVIALTSTDFVHGFSLPDLKTRIDVPPGKGVELTLRSLPAGRFIYLCDNFCGDQHDRMNGVLTVV
jgi:cytochrome c oxidase subunit 2